MARKRKIVKEIEMTGFADKGKAVGRDSEGKVYFVDGPIPGDIVDVQLGRKKKGVFFGYAVEYHKYSEDRAEPFCDHFADCGGCKWQHVLYEAQLKHKSTIVSDAFNRIAKVPYQEMEPILASDRTKEYRNKMVYSFARRRWVPKAEISTKEDIDFLNGLGLHPAGAFDKVIDIIQCHLQDDYANKIKNAVRDYTIERNWSYFDPRANKGFLRNLFLRNNRAGDWMVNLVFHKHDERVEELLDYLKSNFSQIKSLWFTINEKSNDSLHDLKMNLYDGDAFLKENLLHAQFQIGPKSFFQTNTYQAEKLYSLVAEYAGLSGDENVYDLYTGIGSIALFLAKNCKQVVGIEEIPEAIQDAKENQALNNIENARFYAGKVRDILSPEFKVEHGAPDVIITDPPRMGMHADTIDILLELEAPKIVYVSCNPATQARDVKLLSEKYDLIKFRPVDMFPQTSHIENIALLVKKS